ncbi:hypothetical protein Tco_0436561 [Tanacetum coccineum]
MKKEFGHQKSQNSDDKYQWHRPEAWTSQNPLRVAEGGDHTEGKKKDASAKLTRVELNKRSGDADLSKDKSGPESPPEFQRSCWSRIHTPGRANDALSYFQLGDKGPSSRGTKLNSTFIIAEVTFTKHKQPTQIYLNRGYKDLLLSLGTVNMGSLVYVRNSGFELSVYSDSVICEIVKTPSDLPVERNS